jgi:hypothetical protein
MKKALTLLTSSIIAATAISQEQQEQGDSGS